MRKGIIHNSSGSAYSLLPFLLIFILAIVFFSSFFIQGESFIAADNLYYYYPWKAFAPKNFLPHNTLLTDPVILFYPRVYDQQLKDGIIRNWNPLILSGVPVPGSVSSGHPGRYYPLKLLFHRYFPLHTASNLLLFIHVLMMGCFMYLYLHEMGAGLRGSLFGAVAYMFNGSAMVWLEFEAWVAASAYLPLLLLCMEGFIRQKRWLSAFAGGLVFGLILLTGNHQLNVYIVLMMFFYSLFLIAGSYRRGSAKKDIFFLIRGLGISGFIGLLIGAIEVLPFAELISNSSRTSLNFGFQEFFLETARVPFRYFITLFFPDFFGNPVTYHYNPVPQLPSQEYMNYNELSLYVGIPVVFASVAALLGRRNAYSRFYILMTLFSVAMMTGTYLYYPFFKLVPGMDKMNPTRLIFLFVFSVSVVSGFGIRAVEDLTQKRRYMLLGVSLFLLLGVVLTAIFGGSQGLTVWFNQEKLLPLTPDVMNDLFALTRIRSFWSPLMYEPLLKTAAAVFLVALYVIFQRRKAGSTIYVLFLLLLAYDLIAYGLNYNTTAKPEEIYPKTPSIEFLMKQRGPFRVVQDSQHGLYVNTLAPFGIEEIGGYGSLYPDRSNKLMSYVEAGERIFPDNFFDRWVQISNFSSPLLNLLNVRYVLTSPNTDLSDQRYRLVFREDLAIYENTEVMPRAFTVHRYVVKKGVEDILRFMGSPAFDMREEVVLEEEPSEEFLKGVDKPASSTKAEIEKYTPDEVRIRAEMPARGWLVMTDTHYPGWEVKVNGKDTKIHRANCNFRAVELNAGDNEVVFVYRPFSFRIGRILTLTGFMTALAGLAISGFFYLKSPSREV